MLKKCIIPVLFISVVFYACGDLSREVSKKFSARSLQIREAVIPDKAAEVFNFELLNEDGWVLQGSTTNAEAARQIKLLADSLLGSTPYQEKIKMLPEASLGDSLWGVVIVSVTPLRREARHASEMVDQVIMGNRLQLLQKKKGWYLVRNHYGYIGWINKTAMQRMDLAGLENWKNADLVQVTELLSFIYEEAGFSSFHIADLVLNASIKKIGRKGKWLQVALADGETGWVPAAHVRPYFENKPIDQVRVNDIISSAKSMLGVPYLWGGKSSKANDCSGFTQTTFRANGIQLPRDASQQVYTGTEIIPTNDFSNVYAGDLLFFGVGKRITHVGISLGGYEFIHQDSDVHIDSLDPKSPRFNAFRKKSLKKIKRIL